MRRYATSVDLRRALEARLRQQADETGTDLSRLRRIAVFDRVASRLSTAEDRTATKPDLDAALELVRSFRAQTSTTETEH
ncbi:hypothetical protein GCM10023195_12850 [Actinoallomurus liliacearum]|uniref:Ribbon-helix-helix protein CopG domain-containing protein n=1 Tax=Actinoallomurus liliacearum TaxID=1080073 RepID=A0ABP8TFF8_9ACTN